MKKLLYICAFVFVIVLLGTAAIDSIDLEAKRQCIVAKDNCEKYADAGACDPKYMKVCEGVEDDE